MEREGSAVNVSLGGPPCAEHEGRGAMGLLDVAGLLPCRQQLRDHLASPLLEPAWVYRQTLRLASGYRFSWGRSDYAQSPRRKTWSKALTFRGSRCPWEGGARPWRVRPTGPWARDTFRLLVTDSLCSFPYFDRFSLWKAT